MGSVTRVNVTYLDLSVFLKDTKLPIFGTYMSGASVYSADLPKRGVLIFGNEANGISSEIESFVTKKISIPRFGDLQTTESLNVATAAAIFLSEFKRR
jgi:TrmH family RNA methyltransferase